MRACRRFGCAYAVMDPDELYDLVDIARWNAGLLQVQRAAATSHVRELSGWTAVTSALAEHEVTLLAKAASAEDREIEPGDPRVCDVDGRVGVRTVDGAIAARPRECAPRGGLGVDKKDPAKN